MIKTLLLLILSVPTFAAEKKCEPCETANKLVAEWTTQQKSEEKKWFEFTNLTHKTFSDLRKLNRNGLDREIVSSMVKLLGLIYLHDDDPHDNEILDLKPSLKKNKPFRKMFDEEIAKLPPDQKAKLAPGLQRIDGPAVPDDSNPL